MSKLPRTSWIGVLVCTGLLTFDTIAPSILSGVLAVGGMLVASLWLLEGADLRSIARVARIDRRLVSSLMRLEVFLIVAGLAFVAGRAQLLYDHAVRGIEIDPRNAEAARLYDLAFLASALAAELVIWRFHLVGRLLSHFGRRPQLLLATSFLVMIAVGTLGLCLPWALTDIHDVSLVDALFTMTSAVCVTGLSVVDVGTHYTPFGQVLILLGIQFGGIGIMTLGAMALTLSRDVSLRASSDYARLMECDGLGDLRRLVRTIVASTLLIEIAGAVLLAWIWHDDPRCEGRSLAWFAVFHSVSAFCNAGFSLWSTNLVPVADDVAPQLVIGSLIVLGGIGFPVYLEIGRRMGARVGALVRRRAVPRRRLSPGTWVVLVISGSLIVMGAVFVYLLERENSLAGLDGWHRVLGATFTSITTRTAGFNTVNFAAMRESTLVVVLVLMWIGGSPSSTAGGIKTTAVAVLFATIRGELRGHEPRLRGRRLEGTTLRRAVAIVILSIVVITLLTFGLTLTESQPFLTLVFESVSAVGTVGLSMGITPELSTLGRLFIVVGMFLGRVGPLTVALAVGGPPRPTPHRLPSEEVPVW